MVGLCKNSELRHLLRLRSSCSQLIFFNNSDQWGSLLLILKHQNSDEETFMKLQADMTSQAKESPPSSNRIYSSPSFRDLRWIRLVSVPELSFQRQQQRDLRNRRKRADRLPEWKRLCRRPADGHLQVDFTSEFTAGTF